MSTESSGRLVSLDVFRGLTIAAMIVVNYPGSWEHVYAPLLHKPWHGITPTDLIFPFFLFIMGVSIALAYEKRIAKGVPKKEMLRKILFRGLKIFAVGIFLNLWHEFDFSELRVAGVLQRIALVFVMITNVETSNGKLRIETTFQADYTFGVAVKGYQWDTGNGQASPTDVELATGSNWDKVATSYKHTAGVLTLYETK